MTRGRKVIKIVKQCDFMACFPHVTMVYYVRLE